VNTNTCWHPNNNTYRQSRQASPNIATVSQPCLARVGDTLRYRFWFRLASLAIPWYIACHGCDTVAIFGEAWRDWRYVLLFGCQHVFVFTCLCLKRVCVCDTVAICGDIWRDWRYYSSSSSSNWYSCVFACSFFLAFFFSYFFLFFWGSGDSNYSSSWTGFYSSKAGKQPLIKTMLYIIVDIIKASLSCCNNSPSKSCFVKWFARRTI
jgi:hypothetical protein